MLLRLSKYDIQVKYGVNECVTCWHSISARSSAKETHGLGINIAQVRKVEPTRLESLQEEPNADSTLASLTDLIITGWPDSM